MCNMTEQNTCMYGCESGNFRPEIYSLSINFTNNDKNTECNSKIHNSYICYVFILLLMKIILIFRLNGNNSYFSNASHFKLMLLSGTLDVALRKRDRCLTGFSPIVYTTLISG